jgi:hypothetical protein
MIIGVSVALNLMLLAGIFLSLKRPAAVAREARTVRPPLTDQHAAATEISPAAGLAFQWSQIASDDLKVYRDNLLAVGCPRLTVRDIILGEINERFGQRRKSLLAGVQSRFWDFAIRGEMAVRNEWGQPISALSVEREKVISDVLGESYGLAEDDLQSRREVMHRGFSWLSAEKRDQLFALENKRQQNLDEWAKFVGQRPDGQLTAEDNARLQAIQKEFDDAKNALLTPEELEESRLRNSKESLWASSLSGFEPTKAEWQAVTGLLVDFDEAQSAGDGPDQSKLTQAIKEALGADRFAQYTLANNAQFQEVYNVTQRYGLTDDVAKQAYEVQQAAIAQAENVRLDPNLSQATRQAMLSAIQQETENTLSQTLGEKALSTYKEYSGRWLQELNQ